LQWRLDTKLARLVDRQAASMVLEKLCVNLQQQSQICKF
jgi:hypothetical protein